MVGQIVKTPLHPNALDGSVHGATEKGKQAKVAKGALNSGLRFTGAVADTVHNPASDPDHASSCCQPRVREAAHGEQEHEGRDVLQRVLVRALDAIEDLTIL